MAKFLDIFEPVLKGDFGLTEEAIYKSIQNVGSFIPLWGGNQEHKTIERMVSVKGKTKSGDSITIFDGEGIVISLDGSAGCMTLKADQKFALNHHAGFIKVKKDAKEIVNPNFFVLFYQNQLINMSISEGSKTLTLDQLYSIDFNLPPIKVQEEVVAHVQPLLNKKTHIELIINDINKIKNRGLSHNYKKYQVKNIPINKILDYLSGNSGLTGKVVYQNLQKNGKRYKILSGSTTEENILGEIPICDINGNALKTFQGKEGLLVVRKGKAGTTKYLEKGDYTLTDDAYILYIKDDCPYKVSLKWLRLQYVTVFYEYSSSSDNGTWNMTGFFENVMIDIPTFDEQIRIVDLYDKINEYEIKLHEINDKIESIFTKTFV